MDELRHRGPSTQADLARITGVSAPTSSKAILLQEMGLLEPASTQGRPAILYRLATRTAIGSSRASARTQATSSGKVTAMSVATMKTAA